MGKQVFINYWIGQEPNPPSPTLNQVPAYVDIVPLAFVGIAEDYTLDFNFLTQHFSAQTIQGWIKTVQANGTKVLFSINDSKLGSIPSESLQAFIENVASNVTAWGVDGIDFDYEPPAASSTLVPLVTSLREALNPGSIFTAPIYEAWLSDDSTKTLLRDLAPVVDYISTMDYTPYPGKQETIFLCTQYAEIIGGWEKLVIGMSCMQPTDDDFTILDDVKVLAAYVPPSGVSKGGAMLYTFSYDVKSRQGGGTGSPDGTWTETIYKYLTT